MPTIMKTILRRVGQEKGQAIVLFVGIFTIIAVVGAIVIDFGVWYSERRGAQTDSDLVSLAGAFELFDSASTFADVDAATQISAVDNGIDPVADLQNLSVWSLEFPDGFEADPDYCHNPANHDPNGRLNAVVLDVNHDSRSFFAEIFGLAAPDIGAHACARAGSLRSTTGLRPWTVSMYNTPCFDWIDDGDGVKEVDEDRFIPQFGEDCIFRLESPSSQVGSIRLGDDPGDDCNETGGGAAKYRENIVEGSDAVCEIGELIDTEPGLNVGPTLTALAELLAGEGECDTENGNLDGIDQFDESFEGTSGIVGPDAIFAARDCATPRGIHIIVLAEFEGTGFDTQPIEGFAAFFLTQCEATDNDGNIIEIREKCDFTGSLGSSFQIRGFFMRTVELEGAIGAFDEFGTNVIRLAE
ncbi:MAG: Tad domain-containing protein [Chloroflexi bacterium]|nr:Tad domain-containing protein [Chloroflexota bacterium]